MIGKLQGNTYIYALCLHFPKQAMAPKQPKTGLAVGLNKGHVVTRKELAPRPSDRKGVS